MNDYVIISIIILTLYAMHILFLKNNYTSIDYYMLNNGIKMAIPSSDMTLNYVEKMLHKLDNMQKYYFIDFGCGNGAVVLRYSKIFKKCIGVEIDDAVVKRALKYTDEIANIYIIKKDMKDYIFSQTPTVLFMYEPLWGVDSHEYKMNVYNKVFNNLINTFSSTCNKVYIVYVTGIFVKDLSPEYFKNYGLQTLSKAHIGSYFMYRTVYILTIIQ